LNAGARSPYKTINYQRATFHRPFFERIGELAAGWLMSLKYFFWADTLILADNAGI
jgi:hypothetical protein